MDRFYAVYKQKFLNLKKRTVHIGKFNKSQGHYFGINNSKEKKKDGFYFFLGVFPDANKAHALVNTMGLCDASTIARFSDDNYCLDSERKMQYKLKECNIEEIQAIQQKARIQFENSDRGKAIKRAWNFLERIKRN